MRAVVWREETTLLSGDGPGQPRAPGWYPDPWSADGKGERYFDGKRWGSSDRPVERYAAAPIDLSTRRRSKQRRRAVFVIVPIAAIAFAGWVLVKRASPSGQSRGIAFEHSATNPRHTTTTTRTRTNADAKGCGNDCGKTLIGDWPKLQLGDCINVKETARTVDFTRVSCDGLHRGELYFVARPDPMLASGFVASSLAAVVSRYCGPKVLAAYAPAFAAAHPDATAYSGMWGNGEARVCMVNIANPTHSIRG